MALFKESNHQKHIDDEMEIVNDFTRQVPFWNYRPVSYRINERFMDLIPELDAYLERLFAGEIDDGNGDVLDNIICDHAAETIKELTDQKVSHDDLLVNMHIQAQGAIDSLENHLSKLREKREEIVRDLDDISARWAKDKFVSRSEK